MIVSIRGTETAAIWEGWRSRKLPTDIQNNAKRLDDLLVPPGNRLKALRGERQGQHSIRINDQWRICFVWREGHAHQVEIVDYH
jgi:toxin HigB-1